MTELTKRERAAIVVLLFIVKMINPTTYTHEISKLKEELDAQLDTPEAAK